MTDATQKCPICGASLPATAKFCGECGTSLKPAASGSRAAPPSAAPNPVLPWFLAGCAALAIHATVILVGVRGRSSAEPSASGAPGQGAPFAQNGATGRAPDISNLTPRQAADRLYERIAGASEAGDTAQVAFFAPMAFNAYANVTPLDADARLHVGLIALATGDAAAARAQADSIGREFGQHLFGPLLKARAAEVSGDRAAMRDAYRAFLANYDAENRKNLPEYQQHVRLLTEIRDAAQSGSR